MRVGLATGPALVGNVGSTTKFNYTVMGDTVNLASRLEGGAKVYGTLSLLADSTVRAAGDAVPVRELDWLTVKGRTEPVPVYEVIPRRADARRARRPTRAMLGASTPIGRAASRRRASISSRRSRPSRATAPPASCWSSASTT